ncbi:hypothetical protein [Thermodesulforhabdus norvegica]|uniref:Uncharacterized protein n=1 Tax=Thermodesulforhabdus norvegica TaxID=39841 RepID=A0A1I4UXZ0_9BACT|nr:hypothetical protein [Thermodesulforhabdus norvegica]SFM93640.1 hypothetical protein SAMN05660836_02025 [Thermodesulforhabdus norvegica]
MQNFSFQGQAPEVFRQGMQRVKIIWTVLLAASVASGIVIYAAENFAIRAIPTGLEPREAALIYYILVFMGVAETIMAVVLRRVWLKKLSSLGEFPRSAEAQSEFIRSLLNIYIPSVVVPAAIGLSVAFYGVVLAFISIPSGNLWVFPILGIVGIWAVRPKSEDLEAYFPHILSF